MPTTYSDQFYLIDPYSPPPAGTQMNFVNLNLTDQNDDGDFDRFNNDSIDGTDITASWPGDTVTINVPGVGNVTYTGVTFYLADGRRVFTPNDGQVLQNGTLVSTTWVSSQGPLLVNQLGPPCFAAGTLIRTAHGDRRVEDLAPGDLVETLDHGPQPIRWIGRTSVSGRGEHAPVLFRAGAIGNLNDLRVSPQHRILIRGWQTELYYGRSEVLVPAKHLINGDTIRREPVAEVEYYHLMFERHEVIWSEGALSESFYPGDQILLKDRSVMAELLTLFPELADRNAAPCRQTARLTLKRREAMLLNPAA